MNTFTHNNHAYQAVISEHSGIGHCCIMPDGLRVYMPFSWYEVMDAELFAAWIDAGCPKPDVGPLMREDFVKCQTPD